MTDVPDFMKGAAWVASAPIDQTIVSETAALETIRPFVTGALEGMPFADYLRVEAMSQSGAKVMLRSPAHYKLNRDTPSQPTPQMQFGTAVHDGVLEPDQFDARVCYSPVINKRTNFGKAEWAAFVAANAGRIVLSAEDFERANRCIEAVHAHPAAKYLLSDGPRETSIFWTDARYKVPCKARLDVRPHGGIADLKTTADASPEAFAKSIANFGYDLQGAHYFSGCEHVFDATPKFFALIAVESEPPHAVAVYVLGAASIRAGAHRADLALSRYRQALDAGAWPAYPEEITTIETPAWARRFNV